MLIFRTTNRGYTSKIYGDGITARSVKADDIVLLTDYESNITVKIAYYDINDNFLGLYNFTNLAPGSVYGAYTMSHDAAYLAYLHTIPSAVIANRGLLKFSFQFIDANGVVKNTPVFTENIADSVYTIDSDTQPTVVLDNRYWPIANTNQVGLVKVDGTTITADADGTIHSIGGGGGGGDITELKGNIDAHTANLLNPTITNATLKATITNSGTIEGGILKGVDLKGTIQADAAELNNPTLNEPAINNATFTGSLIGNGAHMEGFTFAGAIASTTEVPTMGTSAKSVATKGYADTVLNDAKAYADSISHGATAYVYTDEAALYSRMTVYRNEIGDGHYEYSIIEIKDINNVVINLDTLNLGTNFLFESGDRSRWLAKKIFYSSNNLNPNDDATKAMFFKLYDSDNYVSKTEFNNTTANLQSQITAADTKIDNVNTTLTAKTDTLTTNLEAEITNREAADTAINATIDNLSKAIPTDIGGNGNKIYLVHNGTKLTPQTDVEFKTVNGTSIIGSGNITAGGSATTVVVIDAPADATNGNLTASQLATLRENKGNLLEFNNEVYYLNDDEHKPGSLVYTHSGYNEGVSGMRKYISITIATAAWTLIIEDSSNKLDKVSTTTTYAQAYIKNASGSQEMMNIADTVVVSSIPYRTTAGTIKTANPVENEDATPKGWINGNIKITNVEVISNTATIQNARGDSLATFNLKTVNGNSLFGSGDIAVSGGGGSTFNLLSNLTASAGVADTTYADYPLRFDFIVAGLTTSDMVEAVLSVADATSGNFAPITTTVDGKFSIYGKTGSSLSSNINAIVFKGGSN